MKVLVVEDEPTIARYIKKGLELSAHVVDVAHDGASGFDLASSEAYDVIILDRMLPKMSGVEVCTRLRAEANHTPILFLTAKSQLDDTVSGLEAGADDYLAKPFEFAELIARVQALGRRPQSWKATKLEVGSLSLDLQTKKVTRAKTIVTLSKKEFALLEFLLRHEGQVFSKEQLAESVWPYDSDILSNTVQVYIGYLRKKLDTAFPEEQPCIHTVRGFGYKVC